MKLLPPSRALRAGDVVLVIAFLQLGLHAVLLFRSGEFLVSTLTIDDTFYYLGTAWNFQRLGFPTFDGLHPTNGVQFLWFWVLAALAWVTPDKIAFLYASLALVAIANAACHVVIWRFVRLLDAPRSGLWMSGLWLLQSLGSVAYSRGLENSLQALVFWCVVWQATAFLVDLREGRRPRLGLVTFLLVLNAWSRIDAGVYSFLVYMFLVTCAWRAFPAGIERRRLALRVLLTGGGAVAAFAFQLAVFRWMGGSWLPVSALVKVGWEVKSWTAVALQVMRLGLPAAAPAGAAVVLLILHAVLVQLPTSTREPEERSPGWRAWSRLWPALLAGVVLHALAVRGGAYWYLAPSHVFWIATLGILGHRSAATITASRFPRMGRVAPMLFLVAAVVFTALQVSERWRAEPNFYAARARVGRWIAANLPTDAVLASWNAGQLGYFAERPVINLDGLANSARYYREVLRGPVSMGEYLEANGVDFIVDRSDLQSFDNSHGSQVLERYPVVRRFRLREDQPAVLLWRVLP